MRLGAYTCHLKQGSLAHRIYGTSVISERHRHRFEVNTAYQAQLESVGLVFSGVSPDHLLPEIIEITNHPWFLATQAHPEFKSKPFEPHPLFQSFVQAAAKQVQKTHSKDI